MDALRIECHERVPGAALERAIHHARCLGMFNRDATVYTYDRYGTARGNGALLFPSITIRVYPERFES